MRILILLVISISVSYSQKNFSLDDIKSYPFPNELTGSMNASKIAWAFDEEGSRNIYVAEAPEFFPIRLTSYMDDTGQELSSVSLSSVGKWVVYI